MVGKWRVLVSVKMIAKTNRIFKVTRVSMFQKEACRSIKQMVLSTTMFHDIRRRKTNEYLNKIGLMKRLFSSHDLNPSEKLWSNIKRKVYIGRASIYQ